MEKTYRLSYEQATGIVEKLGAMIDEGQERMMFGDYDGAPAASISKGDWERWKNAGPLLDKMKKSYNPETETVIIDEETLMELQNLGIEITIPYTKGKNIPNEQMIVR